MHKKTILFGLMVVISVGGFAGWGCAEDAGDSAVAKARHKAAGLMQEGRKLRDDAVKKAKKGRYRDAVALADLSMEKLTAAYKCLKQHGIKDDDNLVCTVSKLQEDVSALRYQFRKQVTMLDDDAYQSMVEKTKQPNHGKQVKKLTVPDLAEQEKMREEIRAVFKSNYAKKDAAGVIELANKLSVQGRETDDDPVARYVLFCEARDAALRAGDIALAMKQVDWLAGFYKINALKMKGKSLSSMGKIAKDPGMLEAVGRGFLELGMSALRMNRYKIAQYAFRDAAKYAGRARANGIVATAKNMAVDVAKIQELYEKDIVAGRKALADDPADRDANLTVGKFVAFVKGEWLKGLQLLAKGSDGKVAELARLELSLPKDGKQRVKIADAWWELASGEEMILMQKNLKQHAVQWYKKALPLLSGFAAAKARKRISEVKPSQRGLIVRTPASARSGDSAGHGVSGSAGKNVAGNSDRAAVGGKIKCKWKAGKPGNLVTSCFHLGGDTQVKQTQGISAARTRSPVRMTSVCPVDRFKLDIDARARSRRMDVDIIFAGVNVLSERINSTAYGYEFCNGFERPFKLRVQKKNSRVILVELLGKKYKCNVTRPVGKLSIVLTRVSNWVGELAPLIKQVSFSARMAEE